MTIGHTLRSGLEALGLAPSAKSKSLADALIRESEAERLEARRGHAAERAALINKQMASAEAFAPRFAAALANVEQKKAEYDEAVAELTRMQSIQHSAMYELDRLHGRVSGELTQTASPCIEAFERRLRAEMLATYGRYDHVEKQYMDGRLVMAWDNTASINRRADAIREAIEAVRLLIFEPIDDATVERRLEAIWADLPALESRPARYCVNPEPVGAA